MRAERIGVIAWTILLSTLSPLFVYEISVYRPGTSLLDAPGWHFGVVSIASIFSGLFAVLVGITGIAQRNVQLTFVSLAFTSLAILFTLHGLRDPGLIADSLPRPWDLLPA